MTTIVVWKRVAIGLAFSLIIASIPWTVAVAAPVEQTYYNCRHKIVDGETPQSIADDYSVSLGSLASANPQHGGTQNWGPDDELWVPCEKAVPTPTSAASGPRIGSFSQGLSQWGSSLGNSGSSSSGSTSSGGVTVIGGSSSGAVATGTPEPLYCYTVSGRQATGYVVQGNVCVYKEENTGVVYYEAAIVTLSRWPIVRAVLTAGGAIIGFWAVMDGVMPWTRQAILNDAAIRLAMSNRYASRTQATAVPLTGEPAAPPPPQMPDCAVLKVLLEAIGSDSLLIPSDNAKYAIVNHASQIPGLPGFSREEVMAAYAKCPGVIVEVFKFPWSKNITFWFVR